MPKKKSKELSIGFAVNKKTAESFKNEGPTSLDQSQILVKSGNKVIGPSAASYETRIWEKVTCRVADPILDPEQLITNPERFGLEILTTTTKPNQLRGRKTSKRTS